MTCAVFNSQFIGGFLQICASITGPSPVVALPPREFDHEPSVSFEEIIAPEMFVRMICDGWNGCEWKMRDGSYVIAIPNDKAKALVRRHEVGHVNEQEAGIASNNAHRGWRRYWDAIEFWETFP